MKQSQRLAASTQLDSGDSAQQPRPPPPDDGRQHMSRLRVGRRTHNCKCARAERMILCFYEFLSQTRKGVAASGQEDKKAYSRSLCCCGRGRVNSSQCVIGLCLLADEPGVDAANTSTTLNRRCLFVAGSCSALCVKHQQRMTTNATVERLVTNVTSLPVIARAVMYDVVHFFTTDSCCC